MSIEKLTVHQKLKVLKRVHDVFEAIADPARITQYFVSTTSGRLEPGKIVIWTWDDFNATAEIQVEAVEIDRLIRFSWSGSGAATISEIELEALGPEITQVRVHESGWDKDDKGIKQYAGNVEGWVGFLHCLKAYLEYGIDLRKGAY